MNKSMLYVISLAVFGWGLGYNTPAHAKCQFPGEPIDTSSIRLQKMVGGFKRPVAIKFIPGFKDRYFVVEQGGLLKLVIGDKVQATPSLDISGMIDAVNSETGFLGFAFHPKFTENGRVFVNYTTKGVLTTKISEFKVDENLHIDLASEKVLMAIRQPYSNHNGGDLHFGPDGYLYIALGDGGSGDDPHNAGQDLTTFLAKILRIDVDHGSPYAIPPSNPTWQVTGAKREIFAYGLRNPWRFSFDRVTGDLWAGDVGQNKYEEIDIVVKGANYGWRIMEANHCHNPLNNCNRAGLTMPIHEYPRSEGASITGGYVYHGKAIPELVGAYIYGDYVSMNLWGLRYDGTKVTSNRLLLRTGMPISSFGEDFDGELYVLDHQRGDVHKIMRATRSILAEPSAFPRKISETGCFNSLKPVVPADGVVPYTLKSALWSDGATKDRYIYVPTGSGVTFKDAAPWTFPNDTVLIKSFALPQQSGGSKLMETRFLVKRPDGFSGYTYRWNDTGTDGELVNGAQVVPASVSNGREDQAFQYYIPSSSDCQRCHNASTAGALGFDLEHLNHEVTASGVKQNQILALAAQHIFAGSEDAVGSPEDLAKLPAIADPTDKNLSLEKRARSYLATQCAHCHNPSNPTRQGNIDLRYGTAFAKTKLCNEPPTQGDLDVKGAKILTPGDPSSSILWLRLAPQDRQKRMPPLATNRVDQMGAELVRDWILSIKKCDASRG